MNRMQTKSQKLPPTERQVCAVQAGYFLFTGIWPLVHLPTFLKLTGPKNDLWLVKTVGALVTVVGLVLALAAGRERITDEVRLLAGGSALALTGVDVVYVSQKRIPPVYLLDAVLEAGLIGGWVWAGQRRRSLPLSAGEQVQRRNQ